MGDEYVEKVRSQLNGVRRIAEDAIEWHTVHLERIEEQMEPRYGLEYDDEQERLAREAKLDYCFLDGWKCILDHINEMSSEVNGNRGKDS